MFLKYLQQTKMAISQRGNPIIHQVSFIVVMAKGDFILFDGIDWCLDDQIVCMVCINFLSSNK